MLPVDIDVSGAGVGEHPPDLVALTGGQLQPVDEEGTGGPVGGEHVPPTAFHEGRVGIEALDQGGDRGADRLAACLPIWHRAMGEDVEVVAFRGAEAQGLGEGIKDLAGGAHIAALLQERAVRGGDAGQLGHLFAAQAGSPPSSPGRQADLFGLEAGASRAKEITQLLPPAPRRVDDAHHRDLDTSNNVTRVPV